MQMRASNAQYALCIQIHRFKLPFVGINASGGIILDSFCERKLLIGVEYDEAIV